MSRFTTGNFIVDPNAPEPWGICDRCGAMYALKDLVTQKEWRGRNLVENNILVCTRTCLDVPNEQDRTIILPQDPVPVRNPRPLRPYQPTVTNWDVAGQVWDGQDNWDQAQDDNVEQNLIDQLDGKPV